MYPRPNRQPGVPFSDFPIEERGNKSPMVTHGIPSRYALEIEGLEGYWAHVKRCNSNKVLPSFLLLLPSNDNYSPLSCILFRYVVGTSAEICWFKYHVTIACKDSAGKVSVQFISSLMSIAGQEEGVSYFRCGPRASCRLRASQVVLWWL